MGTTLGTGFNPPQWIGKPLTHITPLSLSDGATYERKLDWVYNYLVNTLVPELDGILDGWFEQYKKDHAELLKDIQDTKDEWQALFDQFMLDIVAQLEALNDQAVANLIRSSVSKTHEALDQNYVRVNSLVRNVVDWGAKPSETVSYHNEISNALRGGSCIVFIPAGKWLIQGTLRLYPNTMVILHPDAVLLNDNPETEYVFLNGELGNDNYAHAYSGDGNITITGGTIDNSPKANQSILVSAMAFGHAENILIENVTFKNNYKSHFVEFNAVRKGTINNCRFINLNADDAISREAINIDYAFQSGFPAFGAYDNTPCESITVSNNEFVDVNDGVGSHTWAETLDRAVQHKFIKVVGNTFKNLSGNGIRSNNWIESEISGNELYNVAYRGIYLQRAFRCTVSSNIITNSGMIANGSETAVFLGSGSSDNFIESNTIRNLTPVQYHSPYRINDGTGNVVNTSGATVGTSGSLVGLVPAGNTVDGSTRYLLENGTAVKIPVVGQSRQGIIAVACQSNATNSIRGMFWVRCDGTPAIGVVGQVQAVNTVITTGVLTGATSSAGTNTLSASVDSLYIENRSGDPKFYDVRFITL